MAYLLSPAAQADLEQIWDYTAEHWSVDQAERYMEDIRDACQDLVAGTRMSRPVDIRAGYRKLPVGAHILFFRQDDAGNIVIVRVLHQTMDVRLHL